MRPGTVTSHQSALCYPSLPSSPSLSLQPHRLGPFDLNSPRVRSILAVHAERCLHLHPLPDLGTRGCWAQPHSALGLGAWGTTRSSLGLFLPPHSLHCPVWEVGCFHSSASYPACFHVALKRVHLSLSCLPQKVGVREWRLGGLETVLLAREGHGGLGVGHAVSTSLEATLVFLSPRDRNFMCPGAMQSLTAPLSWPCLQQAEKWIALCHHRHPCS